MRGRKNKKNNEDRKKNAKMMKRGRKKLRKS